MDILTISPHRADVQHLIDRSNEYFAAHYPVESNHLDSAEELSQPNVFLVGAIEQGTHTLLGIGAIKILTDDVRYGEVKRVFVLPEYRGRRISMQIMATLESHLFNLGVYIARLETGVNQPAALGLYKKLGYRDRGPFGHYKRDPNSVFMEKIIRA